MIRFYKTKEKYGCFSNFSRHQIILDGKIYPTSEHAYQAFKFSETDPEFAEKIRVAPTPGEAAKLGRTIRTPGMREDWDSVKYSIMKRVVLKKFETHPGIKKTLLDTGDQEIVEASDIDPIWGCGSDGKGQNWLGKILQEVRKELRDRRG